MRILYVATDQVVPGTKGGSIHVTAVATGLAALGHEVHVLVGPGAGSAPAVDGVHWHRFAPPFGMRQLRFLRSSAVRALGRSIKPAVVIERYYNFGGEGMAAAAAATIPYVLEVNAPIVDYHGSPKRIIDRALLVEPMRRWRDRQCAAASLLVTPSASIVPDWVPRDRILEVEWGADTRTFHPGAAGPIPFERRAGEVVALFAGAFRRWHGAVHLVDAVRQLRARGRREIAAVLIGDGPELAGAQQAAAGVDGITFTGAVPHEAVPACLAAANIGVAPFDVDAHGPLALDFYWSPLKVFEYMASGLPVVAPDIPRLRHIVRNQVDGILYDPSDPGSLTAALERLADDEPLRRTYGQSAREHVVAQFGWDVHCRALDAALRRCAS